MKSNKNKKKDNEKINPISVLFKDLGNYVKQKYPFLLIFFFGFLAVSALNFLKISTNDTVAGFSIENYEIGMNSDRTVVATKSIPADEANPVSVEEGEVIIKKGFDITEEAYHKLEKLIDSPIYIDYRSFFNKELFLFLLAIMWYMLFSFIPFNRKIFIKEPLLQVIFFILIYFVAAFGSKLSFFSDEYSICILLPSCFFTMLITILYGQSSALIFSFVISLGILGATDWSFVPFIFTLSTSLSSSCIVRKIEKRLDLVLASVILSVLNVVFLVILVVIFNRVFTSMGSIFIGIAINGFISGILTLGFLTPLEFLLNTASVFRLMDLSDLNNSLMRKMLVTASGTYNHSLMVAQLAESACREIGANPLVARVGAYYHDIGKIDQSEYFVENQKGENKHDDINPTLSVAVIRSHVKKGIEKAHQLHLPKVIVDIIAEHHGNSVISYFYNEAKEKDPTLTPEDFAYKGNPPSTKESAVVMLADTIEAACRTLENPSVPRLEKFITTLINSKIEHNQLNNCDLTFKDIYVIKDAFVQILAGYYHSRIEYPDQVNPDEKTSDSNEKKDSTDKNGNAAESDSKVKLENNSLNEKQKK